MIVQLAPLMIESPRFDIAISIMLSPIFRVLTFAKNRMQFLVIIVALTTSSFFREALLGTLILDCTSVALIIIKPDSITITTNSGGTRERDSIE